MARARNPLVVAGLVAVVAGLVALAVLVTHDPPSPAPVAATPLPLSEPENQPHETTLHAARAPATPPSQIPDTAATPEPPPEGVRVYRTDGGSVVRDHRPGSTGHIPDEIRRPPRRTRVTKDTLLAVRGKVMPIFHSCAEDNATAHGDKAMVQATLTVSIAKEQLTVDSVSVTTRDVDDDAGLVDCIQHDISALAMTVPGAADVAGHKITLPARL